MYSVQVNVSFSFLEEKLFQLSSWLWDSQRTTVIDHSHFEFAIQFPVLSFPCLTFFSTVSDLIRFFSAFFFTKHPCPPSRFKNSTKRGCRFFSRITQIPLGSKKETDKCSSQSERFLSLNTSTTKPTSCIPFKIRLSLLCYKVWETSITHWQCH